MANYTNQFPPVDQLKVNDTLTFTQTMTGTIPQGIFEIEVYGARSGDSGIVRYISGYSLGSFDTRTSTRYPGGKPVAAKTKIARGSTSNISITVAKNGANGKDEFVGEDFLGPIEAHRGEGEANTVTGISEIRARTSEWGAGNSLYFSTVVLPVNGSKRTPTIGYGRPGADGFIDTALDYVPLAPKATPQVILRVIKLNRPPSTPSYIKNKTEAFAKRIIDLECGESFDPESDPIVYVWETRSDSGVWVTARTADGKDAITKDRFASVIVADSGTSVQFRVKARDDKGAESDYIAGSSIPIIYNYPPTISGQDEDKGIIEKPFVYQFSVDDQDAADQLYVKCSVNNKLVFEIDNAERKKEYSVDLSDIWRYLAGTNHSLVIEVDDNKGGEAKRIIKFSKSIPRLQVITAKPIVFNGDTKIQNIMPFIHFFAEPGAIALIEANNNWPSDTADDWHDITAANIGKIYKFPTEGSGQLMVRVKIENASNPDAEIIFQGGTFVLNASGDLDTIYAVDVQTRPEQWVSGGILTTETNALQAFNALSSKVPAMIQNIGFKNFPNTTIKKTDWVLQSSGDFAGFYGATVSLNGVTSNIEITPYPTPQTAKYFSSSFLYTKSDTDKISYFVDETPTDTIVFLNRGCEVN